jgi:hypothetical protein
MKEVGGGIVKAVTERLVEKLRKNFANCGDTVRL